MRKLRFVFFSSDYPNLPLIHNSHTKQMKFEGWKLTTRKCFDDDDESEEENNCGRERILDEYTIDIITNL